MNVVIVLAAKKINISKQEGGENNKMMLLLTEQYYAMHRRNILGLPTGFRNDSNEALETVAERTLRVQTRYQSKKMIFLGEGAILPGLIGEIVSFFLAIDIEKTEHIPENEETITQQAAEDIKVHEAPIIHIGPWTYKTGLMIAPTLWAGLYLRIAYLLAHPLDGSIQ